MNVLAYVDQHKTWVAAIGACVVGTVLCWFGKINGTEWVGMLVSVFFPLVTKDTVVEVKSMNAAAP